MGILATDPLQLCAMYDKVAESPDVPQKTSWLRRRFQKKAAKVTDMAHHLEETLEHKLHSHSPPSIEVTSPTLDQAILAGKSLSIKWKTSFTGGFVRIALCHEGSHDEEGKLATELVISESTFNDGSFSWNTKTGLQQTRYVIVISNHDTEGESPVFSIAENKKQLQRIAGSAYVEDEYDEYDDEEPKEHRGYCEQRKKRFPHMYDPERRSANRSPHIMCVT